MGRLTGRIVPVRALEERQIGAWADLASRALEPNPLFEPACVLPAATYLPDGERIALVMAEDGGTLYGCMPVKPSVRWSPISVPTMTTDVRRMTYLGTPLVDPSRGGQAVVAMLEALVAARRPASVRLAELRWLHAGPVDQLVREALDTLGLAVASTEFFDRPFVSRRDDRAYTSFNSKYRSVLKRRWRQMGTELGGELELRERGSEPGAVELLTDLEARGYKGRDGIALNAGAGETGHFLAMASAFAAQGRLQVLSLEAAGRVAAMQMSVRGAEGLFALKIAYDEELARFGPGTALQIGSIDHFHDHTDASWIDSCTYAENESLLRIYPDRRRIVSYLVGLGGTAERGLLKALPHLRTLRRSAVDGRSRLGHARRAMAARSAG